MKILIVDDELHIREAVVSILINHGYSDISTAVDGIDALEQIQLTRPELVIADIRMPGMDGIKLLSTVKQQDEHIVFVFISGYDLFEYAQKALQFGAFSYLLKPIKEAELIAVIEKIAENLLEQRWQQENQSLFQKKAAQGNELLRKQFILELLSNDYMNEKYVAKKLEELDLQFDLKYYFTLIISIDDYAKLTQGFFKSQVNLYKFSVENIASEILRSYKIHHYVFPYEDGQGFLIHFSEACLIDSFEEMRKVMSEVQLKIATYAKFTVTIGMGQIVNRMDKLHFSYNSAVKAVMQRLVKGNGQVFHMDKNIDFTEQSSLIDFKTEQELLVLFERSDKTGIFKLFDSFYLKFSSHEMVDIEDLMKLNFQLILSMYKIMDQLGIKLEDVFGDELILYNEANTLQGIDQIVQWFHQKLDTCFIILDETREKGNKRIVDLARDYIRDHYSEDITLDAVAKYVNMSPGYFSKQFKQEFGENFVDYMVHYRITKSKELLKKGIYNVKEVSEMVGFNDDKYFYKVFKRITGLTPKEYSR